MKRTAVRAGLAATLLMTGLAAWSEVRLGDLVVAYWQDQGMYYFGTPVAIDNNIRGGGYLVVFADGTSSLVPRALVAEYRLEVGTRVYARWGDTGMYPGRAVRIVGNAVFVRFDDGDEGWTSLAGIALEPKVVPGGVQAEAKGR